MNRRIYVLTEWTNKKKKKGNYKVSIDDRLRISKEKRERAKEEEEEKALMPTDTILTVGEKSISQITPKQDIVPKEDDNDDLSNDGSNDSETGNTFKEQLDDGIVVEEIVLDGILKSMETRKTKVLL